MVCVLNTPIRTIYAVGTTFQECVSRMGEIVGRPLTVDERTQCRNSFHRFATDSDDELSQCSSDDAYTFAGDSDKENDDPFF